jgi:hypothetical protein
MYLGRIEDEEAACEEVVVKELTKLGYFHHIKLAYER